MRCRQGRRRCWPLWVLLSCWLAWPVAAETVRVAVAANFRHTLADSLGPAFREAKGHGLTISSASTGVLYNQVVHGAPFHVLLAADSLRPRLLEEQGLAVTGSRFTYALGDLVLVYQPALSAAASQGPAEVLRQPGLTLAIANPDLAPYGVAAQQVLQRTGADADAIRLLRATNVSQAYQLWHSGGADAALVARSLIAGDHLAIPDDWYDAPRQQAVLLRAAAGHPAAAEFLRFLRSPTARRLIVASGYRVEDVNGG